MKTKFLFTAALVAMAFTSCQKDEAGQDAPVQQGQDTYIGMTIQLPASAIVRANGDDNATDAESKIEVFSVGVWRDGENAITYTKFNVDQFTDNKNGTYTLKAAVKAKTGSNNVFVSAGYVAQRTIPEINGQAIFANIDHVAHNGQFVMYSDKVVKVEAVLLSKEDAEAGATPSNIAQVTMRRAAAKVAVTSSLPETTVGTPDISKNGMLTNIVWNIANQNTHMTTIANLIDPNGAFEVRNVKSPFNRLAATLPITALPKLNDTTSVAYCLENSKGGEVYKENNTTAVQVSAVFTPDAQKYVAAITGSSSANAALSLGQLAMDAGTTFYVAKVNTGVVVTGTFFAEAAVDNAVAIYALDKDKDFVKYEGGKCFWAVWINDGAALPNYGVLRNHMYTMNIKGIKAPGLPAFPDSTDPIAADTWIKVDLTVEKWNVKGMGDIEL